MGKLKFDSIRNGEEMSVNILLSAYNGEKYLCEQINSILEQTYSDISLIVRDDGSNDTTCEILKEYADDDKLIWYAGENLGCAKSFWHLLCNCKEADYYAFCDQDDVWDTDKIKIAVDMLKSEDSNIPLLYCSMVRVTDESLNYKYDYKYEFLDEKYLAYYPNSLACNIAPGCTFVFNDKLRKILAQYDCDKYGINIHDWNAYAVASCFGKVIYDNQTHMSYRQHSSNAIGASPTKHGLSYLCTAFKKALDNKNPGMISKLAYGLEKCYGKYMSEENRRYTYITAHCTESFKNKCDIIKLNIFNKKGLKFFYFVFKVLSNRL